MKFTYPSENILKWKKLETKYEANRGNGLIDNEEILFLETNHPTLLIAPHATNHLRFGTLKISEPRTGSIAEMVHSFNNVSVLTVTKNVPDWQENWDERNDQFTKVLRNQHKTKNLILDMHGMSNKYGVDVCIGNGNMNSPLLDEIFDIAENTLSSFTVAKNFPFDGDKPYTVTSFFKNQTKLAVLQIELCARIRNINENSEEADQFLTEFISFVDEASSLMLLLNKHYE